MGDRAYARVTVAGKHLDHVAGVKKRGDMLTVREVIEFAWFTEDGNDEHTTDFTHSEANWGGADMYNDLIACGVPFMGSNESGGEYDALEWAFSGRGKCVVSVSTSGDRIMCAVNTDGKVDRASLANVRRYLRTLKTAERKMGVPCA